MVPFAQAIAFALSKVGCPYIFGANGQIPTREFILAKARQYPDIYDTEYLTLSLMHVGDRDEAGNLEPAFDCSGLIDCSIGGVDLNAQGYYVNSPRRGLISNFDKRIGSLLFRYSTSSSKMVHVGLYIGNGKVVEAKGVRQGVIVSDLATGTWTHFGLCHLYDYQGAITSMTLKIGSTGEDVKALQTKLNSLGYTLVVDGSFGSKTDAAVRDFQSKHGLTVDGIVGEQTMAAIESALKPAPVVDLKPVLDAANLQITELEAQIASMKAQFLIAQEASAKAQADLEKERIDAEKFRTIKGALS